MKVYVDENLPPKLAVVLDAIGAEAASVRTLVDPGASDVEIFEHMAGKDAVLLTLDKVFRVPAQATAMRRHRTRAIILRLGRKRLPFSELVWRLVKKWPEVVAACESTSCRPPWVMEVSLSRGSPRAVPLDKYRR